jgi:nucleoside-diphosphate-sugar epimerase
MFTILGAGGAIGAPLHAELVAAGHHVRLVSRSARPGSAPAARTELVAADLANADEAAKAVEGSEVAFLVAGLKYDIKVWKELWPRIMRNTIEAAKRANTKLVFFDNVYMYGKVDGRMTEETPFRPVSRKGEVRAEIATMLLDEIRAGNLTALIARAPDFYGPNTRTGVPNVLVFERFAKRQRAMWLVNDAARHSFTFTPDAARSLVQLATSETAWNQTWHVPTERNPMTGREFIEAAAQAMGEPAKYFVLSRPMMKLSGWFNGDLANLYEMLYQYESDYIFDSTKFSNAFGPQATSWQEGIRQIASTYKSAHAPA